MTARPDRSPTRTLPPESEGARTGRTRMRVAAALLPLALLAAVGCQERKTPEETAYEFRDVFPYPAITGDGDDTSRLAPLLQGYLIYIKREDFSAAAAEFERVARKHADLPEARLLQGFSLVLADRPADAIPVLEAFVAETPGYAPAHWFLGQAYFSVGRRDDAMASMRTVASLGSLYAAEARKVLAAGE